MGNKSILEVGGLHYSSARKCMCYYSRCNLTLLSDSYFMEQFQKSGYDAIEHALTKVTSWNSFRNLDMMSYSMPSQR